MKSIARQSLLTFLLLASLAILLSSCDRSWVFEHPAILFDRELLCGCPELQQNERGLEVIDSILTPSAKLFIVASDESGEREGGEVEGDTLRYATWIDWITFSCSDVDDRYIIDKSVTNLKKVSVVVGDHPFNYQEVARIFLDIRSGESESGEASSATLISETSLSPEYLQELPQCVPLLDTFTQNQPLLSPVDRINRFSTSLIRSLPFPVDS